MCIEAIKTTLTSRMSWALGAVYLVIIGSVLLNTWVLLDTKLSAYTPLEYHNPRRVVERTAEQGTFVDVIFEWCNSDPNALITSATAFQGGEDNVLVPSGQVVLDLAPGCHEEKIRVNLPETVTPGRWILGGSDRAIATNGQQQTVLWYSDSFLVTSNGTQ